MLMEQYAGPIDFEYIFSENMHYYRLLGVPKSADSTQIKRAYRQKALEHHPDHGGNICKFHQIQNAKTVLLNPETRAIYDELGEPGIIAYRINKLRESNSKWENLTQSQKKWRVLKYVAVGTGCFVCLIAFGSWVCTMVGFTRTGIAAGSLASRIHSAIAPLTRGSLFSILQSAGQRGLLQSL